MENDLVDLRVLFLFFFLFYFQSSLFLTRLQES